MESGIGVACGGCDAFNPMGTPSCVSCGHDLTLFGADAGVKGAQDFDAHGPTTVGQPAPDIASVGAPLPSVAADGAPEGTASYQQLTVTGAAQALSEEELMEQARNFVCKECSTPVPSGHKFCGACGATVPKEIQDLQTNYFGSMQAPGKARLILIRGDQEVDGLSYLLQGSEHVAGRREAQIPFPQDAWLNDRHANFIYRGEKLIVRDEGSTNGVYIRVKGPVEIKPDDQFLCGEQVFRLELMPQDTGAPDGEQTYFYSSPKRPSPFRVVQVLVGGPDGMVFCARENIVTVGREESDMNFPMDVYMSGAHARIEMGNDGRFMLVDNGSRNGTYVRVAGEHELAHGDYLFLGHQLLRVEMTG